MVWVCPDFRLQAQIKMPNQLSKTDKIYGLSKFWQEVNYNFVYLNKIDRDQWEEDYKSLIMEVQKTENDYEYYRLLQKFCASLKDGHTNVYFPKKINELIYISNFGPYRLFVTACEGKAIIYRVNASKKDEIPIGTEILKVNGLSADEYANQYVKPYIASSTDYILENWKMKQLLRAPAGTKFDLLLKKPDGEEFSLSLTHEECEEKAVFPDFIDRGLLELKWPSPDVLYIALNSFSDPEIVKLFKDALPEIRKANKLIIDLRYNGGGSSNIGMEILGYFTHDKELHSAVSESRLHIPAFKAWGQWVEAKDTLDAWGKQAYFSGRDDYFHKFPSSPMKLETKKTDRLVVPTVILMGNYTASAAEDFLISADNQNHMTTMGDRSFGSTGQPILFDLPGGGSARVCTKKDTYPDGREFVGVGIAPDIVVRKNLDSFLKDEDPVLDRAIAFLKEQGAL
ncbi:hypothetical protein PEDI_34890 [Persicobacter diffluens]|uniref:Tail specific protease domain-containing protein n=2 Tax=Persicobacter diffluens TaxID=981 RepID=A0AAN5ALL1_9BACT|nr:hypothetical protein PEDI_34890 [Persicobacter diffluens]